MVAAVQCSPAPHAFRVPSPQPPLPGNATQRRRSECFFLLLCFRIYYFIYFIIFSNEKNKNKNSVLWMARRLPRQCSTQRSERARSLARWLWAGSGFVPSRLFVHVCVWLMASAACLLRSTQHLAVGRYPRLTELGWSERAQHLVRFMRTAHALFIVSLDYKSLSYYQYGTPEYAERRSQVWRGQLPTPVRQCNRSYVLLVPITDPPADRPQVTASLQSQCRCLCEG